MFGAGASYGSDSEARRDQLPPLGKDLFSKLASDSSLAAWRGLPEDYRHLFSTAAFETAMGRLLADEAVAVSQLRRDWELARYFSRFRPTKTNLYMRFAKRIAQATRKRWSGGIVTLNYERLLEESLLRHRLFPVVRGVAFYDDRLPPVTTQETIEVVYPHGACHFYLGINPFDLKAGGNVVLKQGVTGGGVNQLLVHDHIGTAIQNQYLPLICRYEPGKSAAIGHAFFNHQRERYARLVGGAATIAIVGMYCAHATDRHMWSPLERATARITYFEPFVVPAEEFRRWAVASGRVEGVDFAIVPKSFRDGFSKLLGVAGIQA